MNITLINENQKSSWNSFITTSPTGHVLQSWEYGEVRKSMGTELVRIGVFDEDKLVAAAQMSLHPVPYLPYKVGYIPRGPVVNMSAETYLPALVDFFNEYAQQHNIAFIKVEPAFIKNSPEGNLLMHTRNVNKSSNPRFMDATSIIDLTKTEEELLSNCRKNTRYAIRKSTKEAIAIREAANKDELKQFYALLTETADRQNFSLAARPLRYFGLLWDSFKSDIPENPKIQTNLRLFFAEIENKPVATVLNLYFGNKAYYPYGASSQEARSTSATEGLMWQSILEAKIAGCTSYNLWGVLKEKDESHPYWGYTFFKNGFGGEQVEYIGSYDIQTKPLLYKPLLGLEKLRRKLIRWKMV